MSETGCSSAAVGGDEVKKQEGNEVEGIFGFGKKDKDKEEKDKECKDKDKVRILSHDLKTKKVVGWLENEAQPGRFISRAGKRHSAPEQ